MNDNFYEIENNPTTGEDVSRVADVASAQELANMENDMRNREGELKETYGQETETERNNLEIADGLAQKYPHAFEQSVLPDGSKVTVFKNYLISKFGNEYNILTDSDNLFTSIDPIQRRVVTQGDLGSPYTTLIFSKEGYIITKLNMDTGSFYEPYFKPNTDNIGSLLDTTRKVLKEGGETKWHSYDTKIPFNNGQNPITASSRIFPLSLADPRFRDPQDLEVVFKGLGNAFKIAEIIGEKKEENQKLNPEEILNLLP